MYKIKYQARWFVPQDMVNPRTRQAIPRYHKRTVRVQYHCPTFAKATKLADDLCYSNAVPVWVEEDGRLIYETWYDSSNDKVIASIYI